MKPYKLPKQEQTKIQDQITNAGMTNTTVAASMRVSVNVIYDWTHGRTAIPADRLVELWRLLNHAEAMDAINGFVNQAKTKLGSMMDRVGPNANQVFPSMDAAIRDLERAMAIMDHGVCWECAGTGEASEFTNGDQIMTCGSCGGSGIHQAQNTDGD